MAEIRSTLDLVLERAARMGTADAGEMRADELNRRGMKLGADFLESADKPDALAARLKEAPEAERTALRRGMLATMLRNLFLPRDDEGRARMKRALEALVALNGGSGEISALCRELEGIVARYGEHRKQIQDQLKEQIRMQLQQALARETGGRVDASRIDPALDPRYAQEWARIEAELNAQYGQALDQYRAELSRRSGV